MLQMFLTFLKIGAFTFGGGFAMIPIIQREVVENNHWIEEDEFMDVISIAQSSPGPIAINSSIYVGYKINGLSGALICTLGTALPSFVIILVIAMFFTQFNNNPIFEKIFSGIRPVVVALIFSALYKLINKSYFNHRNLLIAFSVTLVLVFFNISPIYLVVLGAIGSVVYNRMKSI